MFRRTLAAACMLAMPLMTLAPAVRGADHRDAPGTDAAAEGDITDVFAFLSPTNSGRIVLAMGVNSFAVPSATSSYRFSPEYLYQFKIDRFGTYKEDFVVQVHFENTSSGQQAFVSVGTPDPNAVGAVNQLLVGANSNIDGPTGGTFGDPASIQVFTGLRDDPFVFDLAQFNRISAGTQDVFRNIPSSPLGPLRGRTPRADGSSGLDSFGGFNASYIVVEFPVAWLGVSKIINIWGTVSAPSTEANGYVQFERMGQPAINTVFLPRPLKDAFNQGIPSDDNARFAQFIPDALTTTDNDGTGNTISGRAGLLTALGLNAPPVAAPLLLPATFVNTTKELLRIALMPDVLRLDLSRTWNDLAIGAFGVTNGRRPADDSIDIELRLLRQLADVNLPAALKVPGSGPARPGALSASDQRFFAVLQGTDFIRPDSTLADVTVSGNDKALTTTFPYLAAPHPIPGDTGTVGFPVLGAQVGDTGTGQ
jgi:Domain of unknown function (DUF4331)